MTDAAEFWDRIAPKYALQPIDNMAAYETTLERTRSHLEPTSRVLEVGCGTGSTALILAPEVGHITGTDVSSGMIDIARRKAEDAGTGNLDFEVAGVGDAGTGRQFDAVLAFNLFHLLRDVPAAVTALRDRLAPGGLLISKTACLGQRKGYLRLPIAVMRMVGKAPFVSFLRVETLEESIRNCGFEIIETGDYPATTPSHFIVARRV